MVHYSLLFLNNSLKFVASARLKIPSVSVNPSFHARQHTHMHAHLPTKKAEWSSYNVTSTWLTQATRTAAACEANKQRNHWTCVLLHIQPNQNIPTVAYTFTNECIRSMACTRNIVLLLWEANSHQIEIELLATNPQKCSRIIVHKKKIGKQQKRREKK